MAKKKYVIPYLPGISAAPALHLESTNLDPFLAKIISTVYLCLIDLQKVPYQNIKVEEIRRSDIFLYFIENTSLGLTGYIGRDKVTNHIKFLVIDNSRFEWALLEGFITNTIDAENRKFVFENVGVLRALEGLPDFIKFIAGKKDYLFSGTYLKAT